MTSLAIAVILNSLGLIALAVMIAVMSRQLRRQSDEITELQATIDLIMLQHDQPPFFAPRYDLDLERLADDDD